MANTSTITTNFLRPILDYANKHLTNKHSALKIKIKNILNSDVCTLEDLESLLNNFTQLIDPLIGLKSGKEIKIFNLCMIGQIISNSKNLYDAIKLIKKYNSFFPNYLSFSINEDSFLIEITNPGLKNNFGIIRDYYFVGILNIIRNYNKKTIYPSLLKISDKTNTQIEILNDTFKCQVIVDSDTDIMFFNKDILHYPIFGSNLSFIAILESILKIGTQVINTNESTLIKTLNSKIIQNLPFKYYSIEAAAKLCSTTASELKKELNKVNISYRSYIKKIRLNIADFFIKNTDFSLQEISQICGFTNSSSFIRFYKELTGSTPLMN